MDREWLKTMARLYLCTEYKGSESSILPITIQ